MVFSAEPRQAGVVLQMGDRLVTRRLGPELLADIRDTGDGLQLTLKDFTLPRVAIVLADEAVRSDLGQRLKSIMLENA